MIIYSFIKNLIKGNFLIILLFFYIFSLPFNEYIPRMPFLSFISVTVFIKFLILGILIMEFLLNKRRFIIYQQYFILFLFVLIILFSTIWARDLMLSFSYIWSLFHLLILYFLVTQLINTKQSLRWIILILILSGAFISLIGLWQFFDNPNIRVASLLVDPNILATFLVFLIPLDFYILKFYKGIKKIVLFLIFILMALVLTFTLSRSGFIGFVTVLFLIFLKEKKKISFLTLFLLFLLLCLPLIPTTFWLRTGSLLGLKEASISFIKLGTGSIEQRARILASGINILFDNFLTGVGIGNFRVRFSDYIISSPFDYGGLERVSHNMFLEIMIELGVLGFIVFIYLIWSILKLIISSKINFSQDKKMIWIVDGLSISLIGVLVMGLFLSIEWNLSFWLLLSMATTLRGLQ